MISEMMKSSIPRNAGSTREERLASGGPWWWSSWASCAATCAAAATRPPPSRATRCARPGRCRRAADAVDELVRDPLRRALGQRRDHDLGDVEVLDGVHDRRVGIGVADHAGGDDPGVVQRGAAAAAARWRASRTRWPCTPLCGTTTMKRRGPSSASAFRRSTQLGRGHGQVGDDQRHVEGETLGGEVDDDVLDRQRRSPPRRRSIRSRRSQPEDGRGQRRDDDLVDRLRAHRVHRGVERVLVADLALAGGAEVADELEREVHAHLRGVAHDLVVDDVAVPRPGLRDDDEEPRALLADRSRMRSSSALPAIVSLARMSTVGTA